MNEISVDIFYYASNKYNVHMTLFFYITHNLQKLPLQVHLVSSYDILDELSGIAGCGPSLLICKKSIRIGYTYIGMYSNIAFNDLATMRLLVDIN